MKLLKVISFLLLTSALAGCVTPKAVSTVKEGSNLNAYNRVFIAPLQYDGAPHDRYGVRADVEQKLTQLGFRSISEYEVKQQSPEEAARTLYCTIQHNHTPDGMGGSYANVRIDMYDMTRQIIYSGWSGSGLSWHGPWRNAWRYFRLCRWCYRCHHHAYCGCAINHSGNSSGDPD